MCVTVIFAHEACGRINQGWGAPAVSLTTASGAAVLPAFLLQLLQPVVHHLPVGGLETLNTHINVLGSIKRSFLLYY